MYYYFKYIKYSKTILNLKHFLVRNIIGFFTKKKQPCSILILKKKKFGSPLSSRVQWKRKRHLPIEKVLTVLPLTSLALEKYITLHSKVSMKGNFQVEIKARSSNLSGLLL